ncbi:hypothetical protein F4777DRAFT_579592 [Nemania sp. FL0916]|nr:hypothetical protein F4777DRAFT_579592 [Nemania sp. FL0916]
MIAVSGNVVSGDVVSGDVVSDDMVSGDVVSGNVVSGDSLSEALGETAFHEQSDLTALPAELMLKILGSLSKKDWLALARTCRRLSESLVVPELVKFEVTQGQYFGLFWACTANKPAILTHHIALDPAVVDRHFARKFDDEKTRYPWGFGMTPLTVAIAAGCKSMVRDLLASGADPNRFDLQPPHWREVVWNPINWAVSLENESSVAMIQILAGHGADMNQAPRDLTSGVSEYPWEYICAPIFKLLRLDKPHLPLCEEGDSLPIGEQFNKDLRGQQELRHRKLVALLEGGADPNARYGQSPMTPTVFLLTNLSNWEPSYYSPDTPLYGHDAEAQANIVNGIVIAFLSTLRHFGAEIYAPGSKHLDQELAENSETPLAIACRLPTCHKPVVHWVHNHIEE